MKSLYSLASAVNVFIRLNGARGKVKLYFYDFTLLHIVKWCFGQAIYVLWFMLGMVPIQWTYCVPFMTDNNKQILYHPLEFLGLCTCTVLSKLALTKLSTASTCVILHLTAWPTKTPVNGVLCIAQAMVLCRMAWKYMAGVGVDQPAGPYALPVKYLCR